MCGISVRMRILSVFTRFFSRRNPLPRKAAIMPSMAKMPTAVFRCPLYPQKGTFAGCVLLPIADIDAWQSARYFSPVPHRRCRNRSQGEKSALSAIKPITTITTMTPIT